MAEYIERERLKEAFNADLQTLQTVDEHTMNLILMDIDEAPAADVAPVVHGRWENFRGKPKCSQCKAVWPEDYFGHNYCPRCCAKMDGGKA